ncbi:MAG: TRAP transporter substrate-binding protein DctP [Kiloniellales bacterium]
MKRIAAFLLAVSLLAGAAQSTAALTIKLATLAPVGSPWHEIVRDMAEEWREASGGRVVVRIYAGGVAGDEANVVRKMRVGQLHAALLSGEGLSQVAPQIHALQMPMMYRSYDELDYVRDRVAPEIEAIMEAKGFKLLNWGDAGWAHLFARRPVVSPADLKPMRFFVSARDTAFIEAWKGEGYHPVPLAATDIHAALQSGLIEALITPPIAALSFQWFGLAKHMSDLKLAPLVGGLVISTRTWRAIPDDVKPRLLEAASDAGARLKAIRNLDDDVIETMKKHGLVVHHVPPEVAADWERSIRATYPTLIGRLVPADMVAEVERLTSEYRASQ